MKNKNVVDEAKEFNRIVREYTIVFFSSITLYLVLHYYATVKRGYESVGGEVFSFLYVILIYLAYKKVVSMVYKRKQKK